VFEEYLIEIVSYKTMHGFKTISLLMFKTFEFKLSGNYLFPP
jgi:hypothetical protein